MLLLFGGMERPECDILECVEKFAENFIDYKNSLEILHKYIGLKKFPQCCINTNII